MVKHSLLNALVAVYRRIVLTLLTFAITLLVTANSFFKRVRMSHENGIVVAGRLKIFDDLDIPPHDFFQPGQEFDCRIRHAAANFKDDAKLVVRSASLKFADTRFKSPLDLMMNTGLTAIFWNARTFAEFMTRTIMGRGKQYLPYLRKYSQLIPGAGDSVRRDPDSFGRMVYYSKAASGFVGKDGVYRYARYRLMPDPFEFPESGFPDDWDRHHSWLQNPYQDETRNRNYLKNATREYLGAGNKLIYKLQIQLRDKEGTGESPEWLSCAVSWDEKRFPYRDVARVEIDRALSYEESMLTWFDLANHPKTLPIPKARSIDDPHSLNHLRLASVWARRARLLSYKLRGIPKSFPDSRDAKDWVGIPPLLNPP